MSGCVSTIAGVLEELPHGDDLAHVDDACVGRCHHGLDPCGGHCGPSPNGRHRRTHQRRCGSQLAIEREKWACDGWDSAAAEIAAASGISPRTASTHMLQAHALRHRLPQVAKLVAEGTLAAPLAHTISWRTRLIEDPDILARVDTDLAAIAATLGPLSVTKLENAIDAAILIHDPAAVLRFHTAAKSCDVKFGDADDTTGTTSMWARLTVADGELVKRRVTQLAAHPCPHDPRSIGERRSAALAVLSALGLHGAENAHLPCTCGRGRLHRPRTRRPRRGHRHPHPHRPPPRPGTTTTGTRPRPGPRRPGPDCGPDGGPTHCDPDRRDPDRVPTRTTRVPTPDTDPNCGPDPGLSTHPEPEPQAESPATSLSDHQSRSGKRSATSGLAVIAGGGIVPTALLVDLIRLGATVRTIPDGSGVGCRTALPTVDHVGALRAQPRPNLLLPRLRPARRTLRPRPQHTVRRRVG